MVAQALNPSTQEAEKDFKFEASLVYRMNSRIVRAT